MTFTGESSDVVTRDRPGLDDRAQSPWATLAVGSLIAVVLALYASLFRPMWFDEFVQFALGGMQPAEAMQAILDTTGSGLNQGHTGVYLATDYWLLQVFGANLVALRLPSIVTGAITLVAAATVIRVRGFGPVWQSLVVVALGAQWAVMYYAGEARPYMPLVASCIATLAYYQYREQERHRAWVRTLGIVGIILGAVSHPYFGMMALAIGAFCLWEQGVMRQPWRRWVAFANPWLVVPGIALYTVVGALTWGKARPDDDHDPWYWFGGPAPAWEEFVRTHSLAWQPIELPWALAVAILIISAVALTVAAGWAVTRAPLALMALGLVSSAAVTYASIRGDYWVFTRQWVVGLALVTIGWVWLLAACWRGIPAGSRWGRVLVTSLSAVVVAAGVLQLVEQAAKNRFEYSAWDDYLGSAPPSRPTDGSADDWVRYGNHNVRLGGPVWPDMADYYEPWLPPR